MEEKQEKRISISTVLFVITLIIIAIMGYFIYSLSSENKKSEDEVKSLNDKIVYLESSIENQKEQINSISNTLASDKENTDAVDNEVTTSDTSKEDSNESSNKSTSKKTTKKSKYTELTKRLTDGDLLILTDAIDNNDGTYTLRGEISSIDTSSTIQTEYPSRKNTKKYRQVTLPANTKCSYIVDTDNDIDLKTDTVKNVFSKKLYDSSTVSYAFNFKFKNGKCVLVEEFAIGH